MCTRCNMVCLLTFSKICPHFLPEGNVTVEDDPSAFHADAFEAPFAAEPGGVMSTLQDVVHCSGAAQDHRL